MRFGTHAIGKMENAGQARVVLTERQVEPPANPPCAKSARRSSPFTAPITGSAIPLYLPVHRYDAAGRGLSRPTVLLAGDAAHVHPPIGRAGPQHRRAGCGEPGMEAGPGGQGTSPETLLDTYHAERHPVAARVLRNYHGAERASPHGRPHQGPGRHPCRAPQDGRASQTSSPRRCPAWASIMTSASSIRERLARDTRCSGAACPISTWSPPTARCGSSPCCTRPGRCCSTSVSPAPSTSPHGRIGFS